MPIEPMDLPPALAVELLPVEDVSVLAPLVRAPFDAAGADAPVQMSRAIADSARL